MPAHLHVALAQVAGNDPEAFLRARSFDPKQFIGEAFAESPVDFREPAGRRGATLEPAGVNPLLDCDMGFGFELEIALFGLGAVVALQCTLDIDGVCVVALDQVAVVAVHCPDESCERGVHTRWQASAEARGPRGQLDGEVGQPGPVPGAFGDQERLHPGNALPAVLRFAGGRGEDRFHVRFHGEYSR